MIARENALYRSIYLTIKSAEMATGRSPFNQHFVRVKWGQRIKWPNRIKNKNKKSA